MKKWLIASWLLVLTPLILGVSIFLLWVITRADWLMFAGYFTILAGVVSVVVSFICLLIGIGLAKKGGSFRHDNYTWHACGIVILIVVNFISAGACVVGAVSIQTRYSVTVTNLGNQPLRMVNISGGGVDIDLADIGSNHTETVSFWIQADGELVMTAESGEESFDVVIDEYVTNGLARDLHITVDESGQLQVDD